VGASHQPSGSRFVDDPGLSPGPRQWRRPPSRAGLAVADVTLLHDADHEGSAISDTHLEKLEDVEGMERTKDFDFWNRGFLGVYASKVLPLI
jgi:hypothetical protein